MLKTLARKALRAGRLVVVATSTMLAALGLAWCVAMLGHLYCLRRGLDMTCVDD